MWCLVCVFAVLLCGRAEAQNPNFPREVVPNLGPTSLSPPVLPFRENEFERAATTTSAHSGALSNADSPPKHKVQADTQSPAEILLKLTPEQHSLPAATRSTQQPEQVQQKTSTAPQVVDPDFERSDTPFFRFLHDPLVNKLVDVKRVKRAFEGDPLAVVPQFPDLQAHAQMLTATNKYPSQSAKESVSSVFDNSKQSSQNSNPASSADSLKGTSGDSLGGDSSGKSSNGEGSSGDSSKDSSGSSTDAPSSKSSDQSNSLETLSNPSWSSSSSTSSSGYSIYELNPVN